MLEYVEVTPVYQVYWRGKWHTASCSSNSRDERILGNALYRRWTRVCTTPEEKEAHIAEMESRAQNIIENVKQNAKKPERYRLTSITVNTTDIPRSWNLAQAVSQLGGAELKIYLDESGLSEINNLPEMIAAALK